MTMYEIRQGEAGSADYTFYGGVRDFVRYKGAEAICHGPAETGKTLGALYKLHLCACKYPGAAIVICRKTLASTFATVLQTFVNKVLKEDAPVSHYGGEKPEWFDYVNGSRIWIAGLDKPGKVLSSELDLVYVNQSEELTLDDWETLTTRTTGRAGHMPYAQTIGDANPSYPNHWMYNRPSLRLFYSHHTENPALYDPQTGQITEQGRRTMAVLNALTGLRRTRLLDGKPAQAEGVIYEGWNDAIHLIYRDAVPVCDRHVAGVDWGFTHPGVVGVWGVDGDGRMYLVAQVYRTKRLLDWWIERAKELQAEFRIEAWYCGPDQPANIQAFTQVGLNAHPAINDVRPGIDAVAQRLQVAGDGKPRLFVVRDSLRYKDEELEQARRPFATEQEFHSYVWASGSKEQPVKEMDDGMDMTRYACMGANAGPRRAKVLTVDMEMAYDR